MCGECVYTVYLEAQLGECVDHEDPVKTAALPLAEPEAGVEHVVLHHQAQAGPGGAAGVHVLLGVVVVTVVK